MLTMQPIALIAEGTNTKGLHCYRVRFKRDAQEIEYVFLVDNDDSPGVTADEEFVKATFCDPLAPALYRSILKFHTARQSEPKA